MTKIWLVADGGSEHIDALLASGAVPIDGLKVGSRQSEERIAEVASAYPTLLHLSGGVIWPRGKKWIADQMRLARLARAPWVSVHLDLGWTFLAYRWPGPSPIEIAPGDFRLQAGGEWRILLPWSGTTLSVRSVHLHSHTASPIPNGVVSLDKSHISSV